VDARFGPPLARTPGVVRWGGLVLQTNGGIGRVAGAPDDPAARTILVIEDSEPIRRILALLLEGHGYAVVAVPNGREGLAIAQELHPRAITLDLALPDVDGREVLDALKADAGTREIPVLVISAYASTMTAGERACAAEVLSKPFDVDELMARVERVVG
jgi:CheY-like chemotaxis protein